MTAIAVDPTNTSKVYVGTAQGGVWRSLDGGATWTPIFDAAHSPSIGALALAPSNPHILYVGTGESNLSLDSFFGVGLYRIDNVDTTATLVGPINPNFTFTWPITACPGGPFSLTTGVFTGRSISRILVSPTDAGTIFVATSYGGGGLSGAASGNCTLAGSTLTITGAGSCTVTVSQAGKGNYDAAAPVARTFAIAKAGQTITFAPFANKRLGDPGFALSASASSGLPVTFTAAGKCKLTGGGTKVHLTGVGSCTITASQAGNANYNAAPSVSRTFTIAARLKPPPSCRVPNVAGMTLADAKKALAKAHCTTGEVTRSYSSTVQKGRVMSQRRAPGTSLANNAKVDLVLSRGRKKH